MRNNKRIRNTILILLLIAGISYYLYWGNNAIVTTHFDYTNDEIPESFDGYTVVQVSDLHNKDFEGDLMPKIEAEDPDIIVVTGDVIDRNRTDLDIAQTFLEQAMTLAPVYFVSGNHEVASNKYPELKDIMDELGVENLDNSSQVLTQNNEEINLLGSADPLTILLEDIEEQGSGEQVIRNELTDLLNENPENVNLLLSHRPELFELYEEMGIDLVLTGHAHGGQIRLPFIEGIYSPGQGFLPEYTSGTYNEGNTTMFVSRGLGNSVFPLRVFNRPELVVITLEAE